MRSCSSPGISGRWVKKGDLQKEKLGDQYRDGVGRRDGRWDEMGWRREWECEIVMEAGRG